MQTGSLSDRTGARASRVAASSLIALSALGAGVGSALAAPGGGGSIWTNGEPCATAAAQNDNLYAPGDAVFVRGANFAPATGFEWEISGQPGGASGDPGLSVVSGASTTDADGAFCVEAYVVAADDWGAYTVDVTQGRTSKNDNYRVEAAATPGDDPVDELGDEPTEDPADESAEPTSEEPAEGTADGPADVPAEDATDESVEETTEGPATETIQDPADLPAELPVDEPTIDEPTIDEPTPSADDEPTIDMPTINEPTPSADDEPATDETADPTQPPAAGNPPNQAVLGAISTGSGIELPATDTVSDVVTGAPSLLFIFGLAGLAGAAVLLAPSRRREPDATE